MSDEALIERLAALVASELGLVFRGSRTHGLVEGAHRAAKSLADGDLAALVARAEEHDPLVLTALGRELTVGETYFFRDHGHFDVVRAAARKALAEGTRLRLWSAGCSSGEEAYSLAIVALETEPAIAPQLEVVGTDLSTSALDRARDASYRPWSFRDVEPALLERWFEPGEGTGVLRPIDSVRKRVRFERVNLVSGIGAPTEVAVVFCRNVLIYFDKTAIAAAGHVLARSLAPDGVIVLGPSDPLLPNEEIEVDRTFGFFTWRHRSAPAPAREPLRAAPPPAPTRTSPPPRSGGGSARARAEAPAPVDPVARARGLADAGNYERALAALDGHAPTGASLALVAAIRHAMGDVSGARAKAEEAAALDATSAEAWTLVATTALVEGDIARAQEAIARASGLAVRAPAMLAAHASFDDLRHAIQGVEAQLARRRGRRR